MKITCSIPLRWIGNKHKGIARRATRDYVWAFNKTLPNAKLSLSEVKKILNHNLEKMKCKVYKIA